MDRTKYMDQNEVRQLRQAAEAREALDLRKGRHGGVVAWAVVDLALSTGLRVGELARLTVGDVDLRRGALTVTRTKRRRHFRETLAISRELRGHLAAFLAWKETVGEDLSPAAPLAVGKRGPLTARGWQQAWKVAVRRAGLPEELSTHSARHTLAVGLLRKTRNLRLVQKTLGHASPVVTANMYADVAFEDMQDGLNGLYGHA
jgi:integrase/recombinase XerD